MSRGREIELKLVLDDGGADRLRAHPALKAAKPKVARQLAIYYDTPDHAVRNAGFSLRVRETKGKFIQTIKQQGQEVAGMFDRPEWEDEVPSAEPDLDLAAATPLGEHLGKKVRKRLKPLIRSEMERTTWLISHDGADLEVTLDEGVVAGGKSKEKLAELEIELKSGDAAAVIALARRLGEKAPFRLGVLTKAERGYALADGAAGRVVKAERIELSPEMSAAEAFAAIASSCLRQFRLNETIVVQTQDPAALHQARVAMRRLRSAFTFFRPVIGDQEFLTLREEVRWFTNQLGDARNLDVLLKRVPSGKAAEGADAALRDTLEAARERAYATVLDALASPRLRLLMLDLVGWIETGAWRDAEAAGRPIGEFGRAQLDKRWRKVKKGGKRLSELETEPLHRLRIEVKKLRYAVEFLAALETREEALARRKTFLTALEEMQEQLGELNDVETARGLLESLFAGHPQSDEMMRNAIRLMDKGARKEDPIAAAEQAYGRLADAGPFWR